MTTTPSFHRDSYLTRLETEVITIGASEGRPWAALADTVFYPEGGGQPADRGTIGEIEVVDVQKIDGQIRHFLSDPIEVGAVQIEIDWPRRWDHMQQHTAQHLLTAVALEHFGWRTTAFHLGEVVSDIEVDVPKIRTKDIERLEESLGKEIRAARPVAYRTADVAEFDDLGVRSRRLPEGFSGPLRLVEIEGLDLNTCGGTHLRSTAEVGCLCLLGSENMRGGSRLFFVAGDRVRHRMRRNEERNAELRSLLDSGDDDLPGVIAIRLDREKTLSRANRLLGSELAEASAARFAASRESIVSEHWNSRDMAFLLAVGRQLAEAAPKKRALFTATDDGVSVFVVVAGEESGIDLAAVGPQVAEALEGRGGGRPPIFQGKAKSLAKRRTALELLRDS